MVTPAVKHQQMWVVHLTKSFLLLFTNYEWQELKYYFVKPQIEWNSAVKLLVAFSSFYSATCKIPFFVVVEILLYYLNIIHLRLLSTGPTCLNWLTPVHV